MQSLLTSESHPNWWLRFTAPPGADRYDSAPSHQERERLRHARLTSLTAPFVFFAPLLLLQQSADQGTMIAIVALMATAIVALIFNRLGWQVLAALLLVLAMDSVVEGALLTAPGGLGSGWLLSFDLFVVPLVTVGVLLNRRFLWLFGALHIGCILVDFYALPHQSDLIKLIALWHGPAIAFARPVIIQVGVCLLSFIEIKSTDMAIQRADRAQLIAALQESIVQEKAQLEAGVQEILRVLTLAANGQFETPALTQDNVLWRIQSSLTLLFTRLQNFKHADATLAQAANDVQQLLDALQAAKRRQPAVIWPLPNGGLLDPLLRELRSIFGVETPPQAGAKYRPPRL